jgi:DNA-binding IclR family transcriptional regulator
MDAKTHDLVEVFPFALRRRELAVKTAALAFSREEFTLGTSVIATAVRIPGKFYGAVNLAVPTVRFTPSREAVYREALRRAAQILAKEISREI